MSLCSTLQIFVDGLLLHGSAGNHLETPTQHLEIVEQVTKQYVLYCVQVAIDQAGEVRPSLANFFFTCDIGYGEDYLLLMRLGNTIVQASKERFAGPYMPVKSALEVSKSDSIELAWQASLLRLDLVLTALCVPKWLQC